MNDPKPEKTIDDAYKKFVLSHSCLVCTSREVDGDHLLARGRGSASQNDYSLIPLCRRHHAERHQVGSEKFEAKFKVNLWQDAWRLLSAYVIANKLKIYGKAHGKEVLFC